MKTMGTMQRVAMYLLLTMVPLTGCGDDSAAVGTTVAAPGGLTVIYTNSGGGTAGTAAPLEFRVSDANGNPVPGVKVRFFGGGAIQRLMDRSGNALTSTDVTFFETTTDDRGLSPTDVYARWSVPVCNATADATATGSVEATIGVASATWTVSITASKC
ncbi:MAG: hypothetical protein HY207_12565 [Nitrospirae bacterium]|nr:hypothetical protein [Nitrospirota bacterium]